MNRRKGKGKGKGKGKVKGKGEGKGKDNKEKIAGDLSISNLRGFGCSGVLYFRDLDAGVSTWYCVDLDSLPEKLSRISDLSIEFGVSWTVAGKDIYCTGGALTPNNGILYKYNTRNPNSDWVTLPSRIHPRQDPFMVSNGNKIYVLGGRRYPDPYARRKVVKDDWTWWGEVYDLNSQTWKDVLPITCKHRYSSRQAVFIRKQNKVVFYALYSSALLFYDIDTDTFHEEFHPSLSRRKLFGFNSLETVIREVPAVVIDSTLCWFNSDLCLYGYDFVQKKWLESEVIEDFSQLELDTSSSLGLPVLFDLYNGTVLVIIAHGYSDFEMATLAVSREEDSLRVSVKVRHNLLVDSGLLPYDGVVMLKNSGSSSMLGKGEDTMQD